MYLYGNKIIRFHGRRRHLGCGANTAKSTVNMGKIVILMPDNLKKVDIV